MPDRPDDRRRFGDRERAALWLAAGGRCSQCGDELSEDWHADHVEAFARGGVTDVVNGQALCPTCNRRKGARMTSSLRAWQQSAIEKYFREPRTDYLIEATPGAGKTIFALEIASRYFKARNISQLCVVTPTTFLKGHWAKVAHEQFAIHLEADWANAVGRWPTDMHGVVVTYAQVQSAAHNFRHLASRRPTMVIFDEIHHCNDNSSWGTGIRQAFDQTTCRLSLSGTPFRSDNERIPFVTYIDHRGVPEDRYGYGEALQDGVCRPIYFPRRGGRMEWSSPAGRIESASFADVISDTKRNHRLRTALDPRGQWMAEVLKDAHRRLSEFRQEHPQAGGIVFCTDQLHAKQVETLLRKACGVTPVVAITDEPDADLRIREFARSSDPWIVSVKMVSEGVDIPRLRVGVYATVVSSETFFRQACGRLVRVEAGRDSDGALLYIPDDPLFREYAETIKDQRDAALREEAKAIMEPHDMVDREPSLFAPVSSTVEDKGTITVDAAHLTSDELQYAASVKMLDGHTAPIQTEMVAIILRNAGLHRPTAPTPTADAGVTKSDRKKQLKKAGNKLLSRVAYAHGIDFKEIHLRVNRRLGVQSVDHCTEAQLEERIRIAQDYLETGECRDDAV
jgi:superfamily II DNA or RNA helicase